MKNREIVRGIVKNPAAPADVLLRLLSDEASGFWNFLAWRRLPDRVADAIVASPRMKLRAAFAENKYASGDCRARLVNDPDPAVRAAVAVGPQWFRMPVDPLPEWAQRALLHDRDARVRSRAQEYLPPSRALAGLASDADPQRRRAACRAWAYLDAEARRLLSADEASCVRGDAAMQASTGDADATDLYLLFTDDVPVRRAQVLVRAALHPATARRLAETGDGHERAAVAGNPGVALDTARLLAGDAEHAVRLQFASRPDLTEAQRAGVDYHVSESDRLTAVPWVLDATDAGTLRRCAASVNTLLRRSHDSDVRFRRAVAPHPNLPHERMTELLGDEDPQTSIRAAANPALPPPRMHQLLDAAGIPRLT